MLKHPRIISYISIIALFVFGVAAFKPWGLSEQALSIQILISTLIPGLILSFININKYVFRKIGFELEDSYENSLDFIVLFFLSILETISIIYFIINFFYPVDFLSISSELVFYALSLIIVMLIYDYYAKTKVRKRSEKKIITYSKEKKQLKQKQEISFKSDQQNQFFNIDPDKILYVKAENNYSIFHYTDNNGIKTELLRLSLSKIDNVLEEDMRFVRCHKSYIINLSKIENITGNSRAYKLHIPKVNFYIPVSRSISKDIIDKIKEKVNI